MSNALNGTVPSKGEIKGTLQVVYGKSAYDIARANGFEGTEKEWLDSISVSAANVVGNNVEFIFYGGDSSNPDDGTQILEVTESNYPNCYYRMVDGEAEWINPPRIPGEEYRTNERYLGVKVIYRKIFAFNGYDVMTGMADGEYSLGNLLRGPIKCTAIKYNAWTDSFILPYDVANSKEYRYVTMRNDGMFIYKQSQSVEDPTVDDLYVEVWYYKE